MPSRTHRQASATIRPQASVPSTRSKHVAAIIGSLFRSLCINADIEHKSGTDGAMRPRHSQKHACVIHLDPDTCRGANPVLRMCNEASGISDVSACHRILPAQIWTPEQMLQRASYRGHAETRPVRSGRTCRPRAPAIDSSRNGGGAVRSNVLLHRQRVASCAWGGWPAQDAQIVSHHGSFSAVTFLYAAYENASSDATSPTSHHRGSSGRGTSSALGALAVPWASPPHSLYSTMSRAVSGWDVTVQPVGHGCCRRAPFISTCLIVPKVGWTQLE